MSIKAAIIYLSSFHIVREVRGFPILTENLMEEARVLEPNLLGFQLLPFHFRDMFPPSAGQSPKSKDLRRKQPGRKRSAVWSLSPPLQSWETEARHHCYKVAKASNREVLKPEKFRTGS